ncbi:hypothetical protein [Candidatus Ichthyocystis hellenicum]|uniref:hypothetical protein n=1 Tax=Candidatus Ichthyocystis hellenicum TaxID=1561003 RepID=UPI000B808202|nr:hypothetical protein [Candidatus Ichthyocystis hellenicum]
MANGVDGRYGLFPKVDGVNHEKDLRELSANAVTRAGVVSRKMYDLFNCETGGVDPDTYTGLLSAKNMEEVAAAQHVPGFKTVNGKVIYKSPMTTSTKALIAIAVLLAILIITFVILAILIHNGILHIPGVSDEMVHKLIKWVGVGLCTATGIFMVFGLGYAAGEKSGNSHSEQKAAALTAVAQTKLNKAAKVQSGIWEKLSQAQTKLQCYVSAFAESSTEIIALNKGIVEKAKEAKEKEKDAQLKNEKSFKDLQGLQSQIDAHVKQADDRVKQAEADNEAVSQRLTAAKTRMDEILQGASNDGVTKEQLLQHLNNMKW